MYVHYVVVICTAGLFATGVGRIIMGSRQTHTDGSDCLLGVATRIWMDKWIAVKCNAVQCKECCHSTSATINTTTSTTLLTRTNNVRAQVGALFSGSFYISHILAMLAFLVSSGERIARESGRLTVF
ncbi:uncharacterized protein LOC128924136 isoform X2 [Zeugodacus cucurbitae]|uniref:uncharacterized protein LOC128924136 isoform X2 n=1 Tax=Zeugodacus cucurbitae TaxID=28588 RepID=UPI0023D9598F|nr:uncharacterized protein LOC128924136 isoform X2 [Zeugodacus cucurbitae]